tara:strand:- start:640 stop:1257 length:618 start_codon:yes stop_codon:yes gene_type:complete
MSNEITQITDNDLTPENLDRVAAQLQRDDRLPDDRQAQWDAEFRRTMLHLISLFEDGPEVILQCKVADQITRVFEKITHNLVAAGTQKRRELRDLQRDDVGIEITGNKIEDAEEQLKLLRQQYWIANHVYNMMRHDIRVKVISDSGVNWGQYIPADEMSRVKRVKFRKGQLTMETYQANPQCFYSYAREAGLVEMPRDDSHATST